MSGGRPGDSAPSISDVSSDDDPKSFTISQALLDELQQAGFSDNAIKKSIVAGCVDLSTCIKWITMHAGHPELDTALEDGVEVIVKPKRVLTEAERQAKVEELKERIQLKKEFDRSEEHRRRVAAMQAGRSALEVKEQLERTRCKLNQEEARREKAADAAARRRVKLQIITDRHVRQGMSMEDALTAATEELERESQKTRDAAEAHLQVLLSESHSKHTDGEGRWELSSLLDACESTASRLVSLFNAPRPEGCDGPLLVEAIRNGGDAAQGERCLQTLKQILENIRHSPFDAKKRTLKVNTNVFTRRILPFEAAVQLLRLCDFDLSTDPEGNQVVALTTVIIRRLDAVLCLLADNQPRTF